MNQNPLHEALDHLARQRPVPPTSVEVIMNTASARLRRRRVTAMAGAVVALTAGTTVAVQQLSQTPAVQGTDSTPQATVSTVSEPAAPTTQPSGVPPELSAVLADAVPATLASEPVMTWAVYDADSPEALAVRYGGTDQRYALATEPSDVDFGRSALYEQRDGAWVQVASDVLPEGLRRAAVSGDSIYAVGTAPATAGGDPGAVGRYDIATDVWSLVPLPDELRPYTGAAVNVGVEMSIAPIEDGSLVALSRSAAYVDYQRVMDVVGPDLFQMDVVDGGVRVAVGCDQAALERESEALYGSSSMSPQDLAAGWDAALQDHCTMQVLTTEDLGLDGEDIARLEQPAMATLLRFDGAELTPVELPDPDARMARIGHGLLSTESVSSGYRTWVIAGDGSFTEVFADIPGEQLYSPIVAEGVVASGVQSAIATASPGAPTSLVDLAPVVVDDSMITPIVQVSSAAATGAATVGIASIDYSVPGAITEPTTFSDSGFELRVEPDFGLVVVQQSSGQVLTGGYRLVTEPGSVQLVADPSAITLASATPDGSVPTLPPATTAPFATTPPGAEEVLAEFAVDPARIPTWAHRFDTRIVSSIDGVSYAVESLSDIIGEAAGDRTNVGASQVDIVDGRFFVTAWVDASTNPRAVILVGTPNA